MNRQTERKKIKTKTGQMFFFSSCPGHQKLFSTEICCAESTDPPPLVSGYFSPSKANYQLRFASAFNVCAIF